MIRINLLSEQKVRRSHNRGRELLWVGLLALVAAGALVFVLLHRPLAAQLATLAADNRALQGQNAELERRTSDFNELKQALESLQQREAAIGALNEAKATPAWLMHELSRILTPGQQPTMDEHAAARSARDLNRVWNQSWDPKHVWITRFVERDGAFTLEGGARSDVDMTQLALRLQASVYFDEVVPEGGDTRQDRSTGLAFHEFTIKGKVRY
jgi:Tfp pilus assembly protein PilN